MAGSTKPSNVSQARMHTRVTKLLGIEHPIVLGGLQGLGRAELAAAVSAAGGLGLITAGSFEDRKGLDEEIHTMRDLTDRPFGVNVAIGSRRSMAEFVDSVCESGVRVVFTSGNDPSAFVPQLRDHGITWVHVAPSIRFARKAVDLGADAVVMVGFEAGGHPGLDDVALSVLVRLAVAQFDVPIIAAGGISDGASMLAAMAYGAEAVQIGTRFVMTQESPLHPRIKKALTMADEQSTVIIERSMRRARRVLRTARAEEVLRLESAGAEFKDLRHIIGGDSYLRTILDGELEQGVLSTGQNVGLMSDLPHAGEVVGQIMAESFVAMERIASWQYPAVHD